MRNLIFIAVMGILLFLLVGCASTVDSIRDVKRNPIGCSVQSAGFDGSYTVSTIQSTSFHCSDNLPNGFLFQYDDGRTQVRYQHPEPKIDPVGQEFANKLRSGNQ